MTTMEHGKGRQNPKQISSLARGHSRSSGPHSKLWLVYPGTSGNDWRSESRVFQNCPKAHKTPSPRPQLSPRLGPFLLAPMKDAFDQWWEWANKPFSDRRPSQPKYTNPSWLCHLRIATTAPKSTKPCGGINATSAQAERRPMEHVQALTSEPAFDTLAAVPTFLTAFFTAPADLLVFFAV